MSESPEKVVTEFVAYVERKWSGGTGHTPNNRWVSHAELRKHAEAFSEEQAVWRQADEQCAFDPTPPALVAAETGGLADDHTLTEYGTTNCPVEGVRANVDGGECSACGAAPVAAPEYACEGSER